MVTWTHRSTRDSEFAEFTVGKIRTHVQDCDGDFSVWNIVEEGTTLATGTSCGADPYHFDVAKEAATNALIPLAKALGLYKE